ncbi:MAG: DUF3098 domain-containing protein [Rubricoccaceae bacterium]
MPFGRTNYALLLVSLAFVVVGYVVMAVDNRVADDPVFSPVSLTLVPVLLLAGYLGIVWALLSRRSDRGEAADATAPPPDVEAA